MPRPRKHRKVCCLPENNMFGPVPARLAKEGVLTLTISEYETIRLIDFEGMPQEECAKSMNVARTTVQRMYADARRKIADSIVNSRLIKIEGGEYELLSDDERKCGYGRCRKHFIIGKMNNMNGESEDEDSDTHG